MTICSANTSTLTPMTSSSAQAVQTKPATMKSSKVNSPTVATAVPRKQQPDVFQTTSGPEHWPCWKKAPHPWNNSKTANNKEKANKKPTITICRLPPLSTTQRMQHMRTSLALVASPVLTSRLFHLRLQLKQRPGAGKQPDISKSALQGLSKDPLV